MKIIYSFSHHTTSILLHNSTTELTMIAGRWSKRPEIILFLWNKYNNSFKNEASKLHFHYKVYCPKQHIYITLLLFYRFIIDYVEFVGEKKIVLFLLLKVIPIAHKATSYFFTLKTISWLVRNMHEGKQCYRQINFIK